MKERENIWESNSHRNKDCAPRVRKKHVHAKGTIRFHRALSSAGRLEEANLLLLRNKDRLCRRKRCKPRRNRTDEEESGTRNNELIAMRQPKPRFPDGVRGIRIYDPGVGYPGNL